MFIQILGRGFRVQGGFPPRLPKACGNGLTGRKAAVKGLLVDHLKLLCFFDDVILQPGQDIYLPAVTQYRHLTAILRIKYRLVK